jgi:hypothetical protein
VNSLRIGAVSIRVLGQMDHLGDVAHELNLQVPLGRLAGRPPDRLMSGAPLGSSRLSQAGPSLRRPRPLDGGHERRKIGRILFRFRMRSGRRLRYPPRLGGLTFFQGRGGDG